MKVTVLGYWGAYPWNGEGTSSYLLESEGYHLLVDAGSSTLNNLQKQIDPLELDSVIISHYHHDHIADLGVLQYYRQLRDASREVPVLPIYGHMEDNEHFKTLSMPGISQGIGYKEEDTVEIGPFSIGFLRTIHPVVCFAMRIEERKTGKVLVYTADSGYLESFKDFMTNADLVIADTYLFEGNENHHAHFTSKEAGNLAKEAGVSKLVLSHLPQDKDLTQLKEEAIRAAGPACEVVLASENLILTL